MILKRELHKQLPVAVLYGTVGGVLLILLSNLLTPNVFIMAIAYGIAVGGGVYLLNRRRFRKDTISSVLYGYLIYAVMTLISFVDTLMNTNQAFYNPVFEQFWVFMLILVGVLLVSVAISALFKREILS